MSATDWIAAFCGALIAYAICLSISRGFHSLEDPDAAERSKLK
jgi:hypothetical protein